MNYTYSAIPLFNAWLGWSGAIPELFYNVESYEQAFLRFCKWLSKLTEYAEMMGKQVNVNTDKLDELENLFKQFMESGFDDYYKEQVETWIQENLQFLFINSAREGFAEFYYLGSLEADTTRYQQGGCYIGEDVFVQYIETVGLVKFNVQTGTVLAESAADLGHGNSLTYNRDDGKIYAFGSFITDQYGLVYIIDPDTLEVVNSFELDGYQDDDEGYCMCYSHSNQHYYVFNSNGKLNQTAIRYDKVNEYDSEFNLLNTYTLPEMGNYISCVCAGDDGTINVIANTPLHLFRFNLEMELKETVFINPVVSNLRYATELESCSWYNGNLVCGLRFQSAGVSHCSSFATLQLVDVDIAKVPSNVRREFMDRAVIYVNADNSAYKRDGTEANPFQNITEALNCGYVVGTLDILDYSGDDGGPHNLPYEGKANLWIGSYNNPTSGNKRRYTCMFRNAPSVRLDGIRLEKATSGDYVNALIVARNSFINELNNASVASNDTSDAYIAVLESSKLVIQGAIPNLDFGAIYNDNWSYVEAGAWSAQSAMLPGMIKNEYYVTPFGNRFLRTRNISGFWGVETNPNTFNMLDFWMPIESDIYFTTNAGVLHMKPNGMNQRIMTEFGALKTVVTRTEQMTRVVVQPPEGLEITRLAVQC